MLHRARTDSNLYTQRSASPAIDRQQDEKERSRPKGEDEERKDTHVHTHQHETKKKIKIKAFCGTSDGCDLEKWWLNKASEFCGAPVIYTLSQQNSILLIKGAVELRSVATSMANWVCGCVAGDAHTRFRIQRHNVLKNKFKLAHKDSVSVIHEIHCATQ